MIHYASIIASVCLDKFYNDTLQGTLGESDLKSEGDEVHLTFTWMADSTFSLLNVKISLLTSNQLDAHSHKTR